MRSKTMIKTVILCMALLILSPNAASVALAEVAKAFPEQSPGAVAWTLTLPFLVIIPFSLLSSVLSNVVKKKTLVIVGLLIAAIGGMAPIWAGSFSSLLIARAVLGAGIGIVVPMTTGLIPAFFDGPEMNALFGYQSAATNFGQLIFTMLPAVLIVAGWRTIFWCYALAILVLILALIGLPEPPKAPAHEQGKPSLSKRVVLLFVMAVFAGIFLFPLFTNTAGFVTGEGLGTSSTVGLILATETVVALLSGVFFGKIFRALKQFTSVVGLICFGIGYLLVSTAASLPMVYIGAALTGVGMALVITLLITSAAIFSDKASATMATGLTMSCVFLGQVLSPMLMPVLTKALGNTTDRFTFMVSGAVFLAAAVVFLLLNVLKRNPAAESGPEAV